MKIIRKNQAKIFKNSNVCDVFEYDSGCVDMGGAVVEIRGRYPDSGREAAYNVRGKTSFTSF